VTWRPAAATAGRDGPSPPDADQATWASENARRSEANHGDPSADSGRPGRGSTPAGHRNFCQSLVGLWTWLAKPPLAAHHAGFEIGARGFCSPRHEGAVVATAGDPAQAQLTIHSLGTPSPTATTRPHLVAGHHQRKVLTPRRCRASRHRCGRGRSCTPPTGLPPEREVNSVL